MFALDKTVKAKIEAHLSRVLIIETNQPFARMLFDMMRQLGAQTIHIESSAPLALAAIRDQEPSLVLSCFHGLNLDGIALVKTLRRSPLKAKAVPVIMTKAAITPSELLEARNAGVHEIMALPFAWQDLIRRLEAVLFSPRPWIETKIYHGPDRRRFNSGDFRGQRKRRNEDQNRVYTPVDLAVIRINNQLDETILTPQNTLSAIQNEMLTVVSGLKTSKDPRLLGTVGAIVIEIRSETPQCDRLRPLILELMDRLDLAHDLKTAPHTTMDAQSERPIPRDTVVI